jgi:hypothetical protein
MPTRLSDYVDGLSDAGTLVGTEKLYLASNESTTVNAVRGGIAYTEAILVLNQTSTNAPVVTELFNNIGTITSSYVGVGTYYLSTSGLYTLGKTQVISQYSQNGRKYVECNVRTADPTNDLYVVSQDTSYVDANDQLVNYFVHIKVYA